jgi:uroporphyrinogen decarboxylase
MKAMTTRERYTRMYEHREADRIPVWDAPWASTIERWRREGMPEDTDYIDFFDLDPIRMIRVDNSPQYEQKTLEETDDYRIYTTSWGVTLKQWKHAASTPEYEDFTVVDPEKWAEARARMTFREDRIDWKTLKNEYPRWRAERSWISGLLWFGFDVTHSWMVGTERLLFALMEDPDWCRDMFECELDLNLALLDRVWDEGYAFDEVWWPDDMGYKGTQFFSLDMYRDLLKPFHQRAIDWAHAKGIKARLHSCGDVNPFVPELIDMGLDALNPLEVKAGMDPVHLKQTVGDQLVLHGGINAVLWDRPDEIGAEMERVIPALKENGGYIFSSDHSVPSSVSLEDFRTIIDLAKTLGSYD